MTAGQYEQYEAPAAKAMEQFWAHLRGHTDEPDEIDFALANAVLNVVGPLIAEDARDRLVTAAGNAVERGPMVDAGRLAAWLRHEMAGAASQREVDAYDRVLRMVEKGGGAQEPAPETNTLTDLIADFIGDDECWFDHHGYCQAHGWFDDDVACPHGRARKLLAEMGIEVDS